MGKYTDREKRLKSGKNNLHYSQNSPCKIPWRRWCHKPVAVEQVSSAGILPEDNPSKEEKYYVIEYYKKQVQNCSPAEFLTNRDYITGIENNDFKDIGISDIIN